MRGQSVGSACLCDLAGESDLKLCGAQTRLRAFPAGRTSRGNLRGTASISSAHISSTKTSLQFSPHAGAYNLSPDQCVNNVLDHCITKIGDFRRVVEDERCQLVRLRTNWGMADRVARRSPSDYTGQQLRDLRVRQSLFAPWRKVVMDRLGELQRVSKI